MFQDVYKKVIFIIAVAGAWLAAGYLLPLCLPFLLGTGLALAAEPTVGLLHKKLHLPRSGAAAVGVSAVFLCGTMLLLLLLALLARQMSRLHGILPQMEEAMQQGISALQGWSANLAGRLPGSMGDAAVSMVGALFSDGSSLLGQAAMKLPELAGALLGGLSDGLLWFITGIISAYMISTRLPRLKAGLRARLPESWQKTYLPAITGLRKALSGWLRAELKLAGIAFLLLLVGFLLLRVENAFVWAMLTTLVDAFPILGVGTVLIPWSVVCLLQGSTVRGIGLLSLYGVIWLTRSILEPKLLAKGMGLDPLVTLIAIYVGWKLWGIIGMLLAPFFTMVITQLAKQMKW